MRFKLTGTLHKDDHTTAGLMWPQEHASALRDAKNGQRRGVIGALMDRQIRM